MHVCACTWVRVVVTLLRSSGTVGFVRPANSLPQPSSSAENGSTMRFVMGKDNPRLASHVNKRN